MNWLIEKLFIMKKRCGIFVWSCIAVFIFSPIIYLIILLILILPVVVIGSLFEDTANNYYNYIKWYLIIIILLGIPISLVFPFWISNLGRKIFEKRTVAKIQDLTKKIDTLWANTDLNMLQIMSLRDLLFARANLYNELDLKGMAEADINQAQKFDN